MGLRRLVLLVAGVISTLLLCAVAQAAMLSAVVSTDTLDYAPGDTVYIEGSGFSPNESVRVQVHYQVGLPDPENAQYYEPWTVTATAMGDVSTIWIVPDDAVSKSLYVDAVGLTSGLTATAYFTDANTLLKFTVALPDSICTNKPIDVCANLTENCGGGNKAPGVA